jgi:hypothetical protein
MAAMATATAKALCRLRRFTGYPSSSGSPRAMALGLCCDRPAMVASHPRNQGAGHRPLLLKLKSRKRTQGEFRVVVFLNVIIINLESFLPKKGATIYLTIL